MAYYLKRNWGMSLIVCILQVAVWGMQAGVQLLLMKCFDAAMQFDFQMFLFWTVLDLVAWGIYFGIGMVLDYTQARTICVLNDQVRQDLLATIMAKSYGQFHSKETGEYISWMTNNVTQIERLAWDPFFECVGRIAQVFWSAYVLSTLHWSLVVAAVASAIVMWLVPKLFQSRMEKLGKEYSDAQAQCVGQLKDLLGGFDILRSFGRRIRFLRQGTAASNQVENANCQLQSAKGITAAICGGVSVAIQILSDILIVLLAMRGLIKLAVLAGGSNLIAGVTNGLDKLAGLRLSIASANPYFENISAHAGNTEDDQECHVIKMPEIQSDITVEDLSFSYGEEKKVLSNFSIRFEKGGKYALTGPSGCGKSTILKILLGWLPDYQGCIRFDGKDARDFTQEQLLQQMSYIEQDVFLFNSTIRDNITLGSDFTDEMLERFIKGSALDGDLANMPLGLDTPVGENGSNLSGGQKQRVAIARALIHNRSILLVDEGTSALDQKNADIVEQSLLNNPDLTLILVSHHLTEERKAQFTKVYELEPITTIMDDTCRFGATGVI